MDLIEVSFLTSVDIDIYLKSVTLGGSTENFISNQR